MAIAPLRNEPVQARSNARLTSLLDAAAAAIDSLGYERLTTAMVAERAGASIGTVYRYFPDRIAVLQSVSARAVERFLDRVRAVLDDMSTASWWDVVDAVITEQITAFREEPAFASLRFGDVLDLRPRESERTGISLVAGELAPTLSSRHGLPDNPDTEFRVEVTLILADSLIARAFAFPGDGDAAYLEQARRVAHDYLVGHFGEPRSL